METSADQLEEVMEVGPVVAQSVHTFFRQPKNLGLIEKLHKGGVNIKKQEKVAGGPLEGKIFVFTGAMEHFTRDEAKKLVERLGGRASSSVSKQTDYVVAGADAGSKLDKAKKLGVEILTEGEFKELIEPYM
jgi:DNA ligase (NAD+)